MELINYNQLFNILSLYQDYKNSGYKMFSDYVYNYCGLKVIYEIKDDGYKPDVRIKGFSIEDEQKWMLTKLKHEISF